MEAHLNFADEPDGTFSFQVCYVGGYSPSSMAHKHAFMLRKILDILCQQVQEPIGEVEDPPTEGRVSESQSRTPPSSPDLKLVRDS